MRVVCDHRSLQSGLYELWMAAAPSACTAPPFLELRTTTFNGARQSVQNSQKPKQQTCQAAASGTCLTCSITQVQIPAPPSPLSLVRGGPGGPHLWQRESLAPLGLQQYHIAAGLSTKPSGLAGRVSLGVVSEHCLGSPRNKQTQTELRSWSSHPRATEVGGSIRKLGSGRASVPPGTLDSNNTVYCASYDPAHPSEPQVSPHPHTVLSRIRPTHGSH